MTNLQERIGAWGDETFPYDKANDGDKEASLGILYHLEDEWEELEDELVVHEWPLLDSEVDNIAYEAADMAILLFRLAHIVGFDLLDAVERKFAEIQTRTWGEPDERGVVRHVEGVSNG